MALTIYVRKDLSMRKGKMAAQAAHAAMKHLFDAMHFEDFKLVLKGQQLAEFVQFLEDPQIKIQIVQDEKTLEEALDHNKPYAKIIDIGRTEFRGIPTLTCAGQGIFTNFVHNAEDYRLAPNKTVIRAKQLFIFNKDVALSKEQACEDAVYTCLKQLYSLMKLTDDGHRYIDINENNPLTYWVLFSFTKIALGTSDLAQLMSVKETLKRENISFEHIEKDGSHCLCISPQYPEYIDNFTGHLSLI